MKTQTRKALAKTEAKRSISVYISIGNKLLLNELEKTFSIKGIRVFTRSGKRKGCKYAIVDKPSKVSSVFTNLRSAMIVRDINKTLKNKEKLKLKKVFFGVVYFSKKAVKDNKALIAQKIINELIGSDNKSFSEIDLSGEDNCISYSILKTVFAYLVYVVIFFSVAINVLMLYLVKSNAIATPRSHEILLYPLSVSLKIAQFAKQIPFTDQYYDSIYRVLLIKNDNLDVIRKTRHINENVNGFFECLSKSCEEGVVIEKIEKDKRNVLFNPNQKNNTFYTEEQQAKKLNKHLKEAYEKHETINEYFVNMAFNEKENHLAVAVQNPNTPTINGGKVDQIYLYTFLDGNLVQKNTLDTDALSEISLNHQSLRKYQEEFAIVDKKVSINTQQSLQQYFDVVKNAIRNLSKVEIDSMLVAEKDLIGNTGKFLPGDYLEKIENKKLNIFLQSDGVYRNLYNDVVATGAPQSHGDMSLRIGENSFEGDEFQRKRNIKIDLNKQGGKMLFEIYYSWPASYRESKSTNISIRLPKDAILTSISPNYWGLEKSGDFITYDVKYNFLENDVLILKYIISHSNDDLFNNFKYKYITQPGLNYDVDFTADLDGSFITTNKSLTQEGLRSYNTTLFGQKKDISFEFIKK